MFYLFHSRFTEIQLLVFNSLNTDECILFNMKMYWVFLEGGRVLSINSSQIWCPFNLLHDYGKTFISDFI